MSDSTQFQQGPGWANPNTPRWGDPAMQTWAQSGVQPGGNPLQGAQIATPPAQPGAAAPTAAAIQQPPNPANPLTAPQNTPAGGLFGNLTPEQLQALQAIQAVQQSQQAQQQQPQQQGFGTASGQGGMPAFRPPPMPQSTPGMTPMQWALEMAKLYPRKTPGSIP